MWTPATPTGVGMFNVQEVTTVKARQRQALTFIALLSGGAPIAPIVSLSAQTRPTAVSETRLMVPPFRSNEKGLSERGADAVRARLTSDIPIKRLYIVPKADVVNSLKSSGYDPSLPLPPSDQKALANLVRADEYLDGTVTRTPAGYRIDARLVLTRDNNVQQPLPVAEAAKLENAAASISKSVQDARKQMDAELKCYRLFRENKYREAVTASAPATIAYPRATLSRVCALRSYAAMKAPSDTIIRLSEEILTIHPRSNPALALAADAYREKGNLEKAVELWSGLLATDPTNARLVEGVVSEIAKSGQAARAIPPIDTAVKENPGDTRLLDLQFRILLAAEQWKRAAEVGDEMVRLDTALATTRYYQGMAAAYLADSQPQKAAEVLARGVAKFPADTELSMIYAQALGTAGQLPQAVAALDRVIAANPRAIRPRLVKAQRQIDMKAADAAKLTLRETIAISTPDSVALSGGLLLSIGNSEYRTANAEQNPALKKDLFKKAIATLAMSDSLSPSIQAKFLQGVSSYYVAQISAVDAGKTKNCVLAREAQGAATAAQINVTAGAKVNAEAAGQVLGAVNQLSPVIEKQVKAFCKGR